MARKKPEPPPPPPSDSNAFQWWKVPLKCYGDFGAYVSIAVPLWDKQKRDNMVCTLQKKDMPPELSAVIRAAYNRLRMLVVFVLFNDGD